MPTRYRNRAMTALGQGSGLHAAALALSLLLLSPAAEAQKRPTSDDIVLSSEAFLASHPDLRFRIRGMEAMKEGKPEEAFPLFQRSAYYADKPSQAIIATMYWEGSGIATDRALAYAWMDLAAERGYPDLLAQREHYWAMLTPAERERAVHEGQAIFARYGDDVAQNRIDAILRRDRRSSAAGRTGYTGNMQIEVPVPGGSIMVPAHQFFDDRYWKPSEYHQWHESVWRQARQGRVSVGEFVDGRHPSADQPPPSPKPDKPAEKAADKPAGDQPKQPH